MVGQWDVGAPAVLFLPDIFMLGYLRSSPVGAWLYNIGHSYPAPATVATVATIGDASLGQATAPIRIAHMGMDRALGYGLKYPTAFTDTHLGRIGR